MIKIKKSKGQVFLMSVLLLTVISLAGLIVLTIFNRQLKLSYEVGHSIRAVFAADSCLEWKLYNDLHSSRRLTEPILPSDIQKCSQSSYLVTRNSILYSALIKDLNISRALEIKTH